MYIGIDLGTTGVKTVMFDKDGKLLCEFNKEYELIFKGSFVEQDANKWWELTCEGIKYVVENTGIKDIKGISISTQSISFVPVDKDGNTLYNALSWLDTRAKEEISDIVKEFGEEKIYEITGKPCIPEYSLPKLCWFMKHEKEIYDKAYKFLFPLDFLNLRLCGETVTDYSVAGGSMLYDIHNKCWSEELLRFSGFDKDKLPDVKCMGNALGELKKEVAEKCGINEGCTVYLGGQDQKLAALGAGIEKDVCAVSLGTSSAILKLSSHGYPGSCLFRFDEDNYIAEAALMTTGAAYRWLSLNLFDGMSYKDMDALAEKSVPGANGVQFSTDLSAGGAITGLTLSTTKADVIYAALEGVSKQIADSVKSMGEVKRIKLFGGGSKSKIWCEIIARIAKIPIDVLATGETASLGAAILASNGKLGSAAVKYTYEN